MRYLSLLFLSLAIWATSCKTKVTLTPEQFHKEISNINDSLARQGETWGSAFMSSLQTLNFSSLETARKQIQDYVDGKIKYVENMEDVNDSKAYREAELEYLKLEKKMVSETFPLFEQLNENSTEAEVSAAGEKLQAAIDGEQTALAKLRTVQTEYVTKNNIKETSKP